MSQGESTKEKESSAVKLSPVCDTCGKKRKSAKPSPTSSVVSWIFPAASCTCEEVDAAEAESEATSDDRSSPDAAELPDLGSRYEVLEMIGRGGMGSVYKVFDKELQQTFAVKVLRADLAADKQAIKRFEQEAKAASELTHPNLVSVYGYGMTAAGSPYLVMENIEGKSLAKLLKQKEKLDEARALDIFIQICEALSYAHNKGVVHRDIKPSNIIISTTDGGVEVVRLVDFGIAKVQGELRSTLNLTETGDVLGTPAYMSPEQCLGTALNATSDIYSLGCIIYETFTGKQAFAGANPIQVVARHLDQDADVLAKSMKKYPLPKGMDSIILRCLERDSKHRYQSAEKLAEDLKLTRSGRSPSRYSSKSSAKVVLTKANAWSLLFSIPMLVLVALMQLEHSGVPTSRVFSVFIFVVSLVGVGFLITKMRSRLIAKSLQVQSWSERWTFVALGFGACMMASSSLLHLQMLAFYFNSSTSFFPAWLSGSSACLSLVFLVGTVFSAISALLAKFLNKRVTALIIVCLATLAVCFKSSLSFIPVVASQMVIVSDEYSQSGHNEKVLKQLPYFDFALWLNPDDQMALYSRATAYQSLGLERSFKQLFEERNKGFSADSKLNFNKALVDVNHLLKVMKPTDRIMLIQSQSDVYEARGQLYYWLEKYDLAIADFRQALKIDSDSSSTHTRSLLSTCYEKTGRRDLAIQDLTDAINEDPASFLYGDRARLYEADGKYELAVNDYTKYLEISQAHFPKGTHWHSFVERARAYKKWGKAHLAAFDLEKAERSIRNQLLDQPNDADSYYALARIENERGNIAASKTHAQKAHDLGAKVTSEGWKQLGIE